jgi:hypothetical protein
MFKRLLLALESFDVFLLMGMFLYLNVIHFNLY